MFHRDAHSNEDEGAKSPFAEGVALVSVRPAGEAGKPILIFRRPSTAAAFDGLPEAIEPEESFSSLGSIAVRLVAELSLQRMQKMLALASWEEGTKASADYLNTVGVERS